MSAHDEDGGAHGDEEQAESCIHYKAGQGVTSEICGRKHHSHQLYPAACDWESHHMERLRFESYSFSIPTGTSHRLLICQWLSSDEDELKRILSQDPSESVSSKLRESAGITAAATGKGNIPELVSDVIPSKLQILEDSFLHLLSSFCAKCNMKKNDKKTLMNAAKSVLKNETEANLVIHRRVLVTWIDICKQYAGLGLTGRLLDDLVIDVINSVSYETGCLLRVKTRESTSTEINVCGQQINVQSGIEVSALSEEDLLQVIISSENKALGREIDIKQILAHIVCQALATAEHSPFGNQYYKTVYHVSIHAVHCPASKTDELHVLLVRCHVSCDSLQRLSECPLPNPLQRSYIMHERIACGNIYSETAIELMYRAIKGLFLIFQMYCDKN